MANNSSMVHDLALHLVEYFSEIYENTNIQYGFFLTIVPIGVESRGESIFTLYPEDVIKVLNVIVRDMEQELSSIKEIH